jgi:hypothetical protein
MLASSANNIGVALFDKATGKSLMYRMKKRGTKIDPCGTPCFTFIHDEKDIEFKL